MNSQWYGSTNGARGLLPHLLLKEDSSKARSTLVNWSRRLGRTALYSLLCISQLQVTGLAVARAADLGDEPPGQSEAIYAWGAPMTLHSRSSTGAPIPGALALPAGIVVTENRMLFRAVFPINGLSTAAQVVRSCALMLWSAEALDAHPTILYLHANEGQPASIPGRVFLPHQLGGPLNVSQSNLSGSLGVDGRIFTHSGAPGIELSIPLPLMQALFPNGVVADARILLRDGALLSAGAAGSWFDPPDASRAVPLRIPEPGVEATRYANLLRSLAEQAGGPVSAAVVQKAVTPDIPLPLDPSPDPYREQFLKAKALRESGDETGAIAILWQIQPSAAPESLAWQEAMLDLQRALFETGDAAQSIETGLGLVERDGLESGVVLRAFRTLAPALAQARIQLDLLAPETVRLRERLIRAASDSSFKATYAADLLLLHDQLPDAMALLESVRNNPFAPTATRAAALFRLAQLKLNAGEWKAVLHLVERIQDEASGDTRLRGHSLALLDAIPVQDSTDASDLQARREELSRRLAADTAKVWTRRVAAGGTQDPATRPGTKEEQ